jgi:hypothetical protein
MTEAEQIIMECEVRGVVLTLGSSFALQYDAPPGAFTADLRDRLTAHKPDVAQLLFEREERAAVQDAPEWQDAGMWQRGTEHRAAVALLDTFARRGLALSFVSVTPTRRRESEAA